MSNRPIESDEFGDHLEAVDAQLLDGDYSRELGEAKMAVLQNIRDNFTGSVTPSGESWPERKEEGDGHPLLMDTGALLQAATGGGSGGVQEVSSNELLLKITGVVYARTHQVGDPDRNIPSREYYGASEETLDEIGEMFADAGIAAFND